MRSDKEEDRNNHAQRLKGVYSQREEIKGEFKARLFFPAFRFRVHRSEGASDDVILFFIGQSVFIAFPSAPSLSPTKGKELCQSQA